MQITVNGETVNLSAATTAAAFLEAKSYNIARIAVELNGDILPKARYASVTLAEGDVMEIVSFVGGG